MTIKDAALEHVPLIQDIAEKTWWPTYSPLLGQEQLRYMLDTIYSVEALQRVMKNGSQHFILLYDKNDPQGFAAYGPREENPTIYKLHKLYVLPENHGKGYGKLLIEDVKKRLSGNGIHTLELNVKRDNPAKNFYERIGFKVIREEDIPIGPYWLNDYVMRLDFPHA